MRLYFLYASLYIYVYYMIANRYLLHSTCICETLMLTNLSYCPSLRFLPPGVFVAPDGKKYYSRSKALQNGMPDDLEKEKKNTSKRVAATKDTKAANGGKSEWLLAYIMNIVDHIPLDFIVS